MIASDLKAMTPVKPADIAAAAAARLGDAARLDEDGALVVEAARLLDLVRALRDEHGLDYLSNLTCVDWPDRFEAVYHFCSMQGGGQVTVKVAADRAKPIVPSLTGIFPGADLQEREVWDMYGMRFAGHPNLRRILMWEGFAGHPLRKDWREAYYEQDQKPLKSRWPSGEFFFGEDKLSGWADNIKYPTGYAAEGLIDAGRADNNIAVIDADALKHGPDIRSDPASDNRPPHRTS